MANPHGKAAGSELASRHKQNMTGMTYPTGIQACSRAAFTLKIH